MKKSIPIENLLSWAYSELLKQPEGDSSWRSMFASEAWQLGARVDQSSLDFVPDCLRSDPHPDARLVDAAVRKIGAAQINWTTDADWLLGHLAVYLDWDEIKSRCQPWELTGRARIRAARVTHALELIDGHMVNVQGLLISHAVSRSRPIWYLGEPKEVPVRWPNGKPKLAEDGRPKILGPVDLVKGRKRPEYLATLDPSPIAIAEARFEFHVWQRGLTELALALRDLRSFTPEEPVYPRHLWRADQRLWIVEITKNDKYIKAI